jgi:hypothetical protein
MVSRDSGSLLALSTLLCRKIFAVQRQEEEIKGQMPEPKKYDRAIIYHGQQ